MAKNGVTLYVVRHAIAAERGPDYPDDTRRPLTPKGIVRFRDCVAGLAAIGVEVEEILTSPYVRARQTADLLAEGLSGKPKVTNVHALAADGNVGEVIDGLGRFSKRSTLALVGHAPSIGTLAARLCGQRRPFDFKKGAVACIAVEALPLPAPGTLDWFMPPRLLRRVGGK